jgi:coenzyme F420 biosynthesis associated uncharacterized protein
MDAAKVDWSMGSRAARLADWSTAADVGRRIAGPGALVAAVDRARLREDIAEQVALSENLVTTFTGLSAGGFRARPWVMSRGEWISSNLKSLQRLLEPLAERVVTENRGEIRRKAMGAQFGALLGYVSRKVLGQYDVFLPRDDEGLIYFIGPNIIEAERRFGLSPLDFRLWISLHEVTHRVQFAAAPWMRGYLGGLIDTYLSTVQVDSHEMAKQLRRAAEEVRSGSEWKGVGAFFLLLTPEQRELFYRMQAMMSLLEGHASFVMNDVADTRVKDLAGMRKALAQRRKASSLERTLQKAIGFDSKVKQYDAGEHFVREVVARGGMEALNRVWRSEQNLPNLAEIADAARWVERVAGS